VPLLRSNGTIGSTTAPAQATGRTYYLAPAANGGSDTNSGLSAEAPWLSPHHQLNCGDVILARAGTYSNSAFYTGKWGKVTCPSGNNVAWLTCEIFAACRINATTNQGMWVDQSYWGVEGWEITTSASDLYGTCFIAQPNWVNPVEIHHIIFANDVANGCSQSGFAVVNHGSASVDYFVVIGTLAYNTSQGNGTCASGITIYQPVQSDSLPGTHLYVAGNFSYANVEPKRCNGTPPTDGEGIIFDTFDGSQGNLATPYAAQAVAENNIVVGNGGKGIEVANNAKGTSHAAIYINQNTSWGNLIDPNQAWLGCGEIALTAALNTHITNNLISTRSATGCGGHPIFDIAVAAGDSSDSATNNFAFGFRGNHAFVYRSGSFFLEKTNILGDQPPFLNPRVPGPPRCQGRKNVPDCLASMIADFAPVAATARGFGYQQPVSIPVVNPLFPQWLCNVNLPTGLVTPGCQP
jgi:serralysin